MSKQDGTLETEPNRPTTINAEAWKAYWKAQGQKWRTEPEIDAERQEYLDERRSIKPDPRQGIYPFGGIKLSRADVEWLLATHEKGQGPIDCNDENQREREGLDLRGADLSHEVLSGLPLVRMLGGLTRTEWLSATDEQRNLAAVRMEQTILQETHLQQAELFRAQLQKANLREAQLEKANLREAQLQKANLREAQLQKAILQRAQLQEANLYSAQLQETNLYGAQLQKANLEKAQLQKAILHEAQLQGANLRRTDLEDASLDEIMLCNEKHGPARLADISWGDANLAVVDWAQVKKLGDEHLARQTKEIDSYRAAVRANRQLAVVLRAQGLNEEADHFAYRALVLQRTVLGLQTLEPHVSLWRRTRKLGSYIFSLFLDLLAGYGYHPVKTLFWYLIIVFGFAIFYSISGHLPFAPDALVFSITSFHGRGFFPGLGNGTSLHTPLVVVAAVEAVTGLFIEISFIATFTQRYYGR